ncbi:hypothetical protein [Rhodococcus qingshengii]|uniref:hypothetical protein n=1 Tax=Rhodococcus qingshengii TaxID=334542 RepID=UPI0035DE72E2
MKEKKSLHRRCFFCEEIGMVGENVFYLVDPFREDVDNEVIKVWLHEACRDDLAGEI